MRRALWLLVRILLVVLLFGIATAQVVSRVTAATETTTLLASETVTPPETVMPIETPTATETATSLASETVIPPETATPIETPTATETATVLASDIATVIPTDTAPAFLTATATTDTTGMRTASIADLNLTALTYAHSQQQQTGALTLTAHDGTGSGAGWHVTVQSSEFAYTGSSINGLPIPASAFAITTAHAPEMTAGQEIDTTNGPLVPASGATGTLDSAHTVLQANPKYGLGTYTQLLNVDLTVPAQSRAGDYSATLTVTIAAAP